MFNYLKKIFNVPDSNHNTAYERGSYNEADGNKKLKIATCTLFIEVARADDNFDESERDKIISVMKSTFNLEDECIKDLMELAEERLETDDSIYDFTKLINQSFSNDEKFGLLKDLWRLIYVDNKLNMYEDHMIKKIGGLLNMGHSDIIASKMLVQEELKGK